MNLILTDTCNRACPYCFAQSKVTLGDDGNTKSASPITVENYGIYLDFLEKSSIRDLKLLGGEPTTHPEFERIVEMGLERHFSITVFTNGLWSRRVQQLFDRSNTASIQFLFNVNEPHLQTDWEHVKQRESLKIAGERGTLGFNIYRPDFNLLFVSDLIDSFGLRREVRLGLAHPIVGEVNESPSDAQLPIIGTRLISQLKELEIRNILGSFDCGFSLCMFPEDELGTLITSTTGFRSQCSVIVDVGPDLTVWPCFPLSAVYNTSLSEFDSADSIVEYYSRLLSGIGAVGSLSECLECKYKQRRQCTGGCLARTLRNWSDVGDTLIVDKLNQHMASR